MEPEGKTDRMRLPYKMHGQRLVEMLRRDPPLWLRKDRPMLRWRRRGPLSRLGKRNAVDDAHQKRAREPLANLKRM